MNTTLVAVWGPFTTDTSLGELSAAQFSSNPKDSDFYFFLFFFQHNILNLSLSSGNTWTRGQVNHHFSIFLLILREQQSVFQQNKPMNACLSWWPNEKATRMKKSLKRSSALLWARPFIQLAVDNAIPGFLFYVTNHSKHMHGQHMLNKTIHMAYLILKWRWLCR